MVYELTKIIPNRLPLTKYEYKISKQHGNVEEGVIQEMYERLHLGSGYIIEIGAGNGQDFSMSKSIISKYSSCALLIEGDKELSKQLKENYEHNNGVITISGYVTKKIFFLT